MTRHFSASSHRLSFVAFALALLASSAQASGEVQIVNFDNPHRVPGEYLVALDATWLAQFGAARRIADPNDAAEALALDLTSLAGGGLFRFVSGRIGETAVLALHEVSDDGAVAISRHAGVLSVAANVARADRAQPARD